LGGDLHIKEIMEIKTEKINEVLEKPLEVQFKN
jgi:hypothetical protein